MLYIVADLLSLNINSKIQVKVGAESELGGVIEWSGCGPHLIHILQHDLAGEGVVAGVFQHYLDLLADRLVNVNSTRGHTHTHTKKRTGRQTRLIFAPCWQNNRPTAAYSKWRTME